MQTSWKALLRSVGRADEPDDQDLALWDQLTAEADTPSSSSEETRQRWLAFRRRYSGHGSTADTYALDRMLVETASPEELRAEAPGIYQRFCEERGVPPDPHDLAMKPREVGKKETEQEVAELRARVLQIMRSLHWSYTFAPIRERCRLKLVEGAMWQMVGATAVFALTLLLLRISSVAVYRPFFPLLATVVYAGVMGGALSWIQRLGGVSTQGDALGGIAALKNSQYNRFLIPLSGAACSVVTMLFFIGQIVNAGIFPKFQDVTPTANPDWAFTISLLPQSPKDYGLLFLWCFISGFAERLIPDALKRLADSFNIQTRSKKTRSSRTQTTKAAAHRH